MELTLLFSGLFLLSLVINIAQFLRYKRTPPKESIEARDLLAELFGSSAVVEIKMLNKGDFLLRSPRG